jgi:PAS domain S-box-containing protein
MVKGVKDLLRADKALKMSQLQLENAMEMANLASWEFDVLNKQYLFNDRFYSMMGTSASEEGGYTMASNEYFNKFIHPDDLHFVIDGMEKSLKNKKSAFGTQLEHRIILKDGTIRYMSVRIKYLIQTEDHSPYAYGTIQDITEWKNIEKELIEREEKFHEVFNKANDAMFLHKLDGTDPGNFLEVNDQACQSLGYTREELMNMGPKDIDIPENVRTIALNIENLYKEKKKTFNTLHMTKDGKTIPVEVNAHLFIMKGEEYVLSVTRDMGERNRIEKALKESEEMLRLKLDKILSPDYEVEEEEFKNIINSPNIQSLMDDFYNITDTGVGIVDLEGNILVNTGWQDICTNFHRINVESYKNCVESDIYLTQGLAHGEYKIYKCKNNIWEAVTPIMLGQKHVGNLFLGQFFFEDEIPDYNVFEAQAEKYGFDWEEYLEALKKVPIWNLNQVETLMGFYLKLAHMISSLSFSNLKLAKSLEDHKVTENALKVSERSYRDLVDYSSVGVFKTRLNGDFLFINHAMANIYYYDSVMEMNQHNIIQIYKNPEDRIQLIQKLRIYGRITDYELETIGKNGQTVNVLVSAILDDDIISGMFMDITARKKTENALKKSENLYRTIFENTGAATIIYDQEGIITMINSETEHLSGYSRDEIEGHMNWMKFIHPQDLEIMLKFHEQWVYDPDSAPSEYETRIINREGKIYNTKITVDKIPGVEEYITSIVDITEQKKQNQDLKWELEVNQALNKLYSPLVSKQTSLEDISQTILTESLKLTNSSLGFVAEILPNTHDMVLISKIPSLPDNHYKQPMLKLMEDGNYGNLMGHSLDIKRGFFTNNAPSHPNYIDHHGTKIERFLSVPVILKEEIVGQIAISNSDRDYSEKDLEAILRLTHFYTMALQKVRDEKELKNSLAEKEVLLREIHHRVKNNMQIISSLLNLQIQFEDLDETISVLKESQGRIKSMAIIHEKLYQSSSLTNINFKEYIEKLILDIYYSYGILNGNIKSVLDIQDINLNIDTAIPLGLIINELVTNSIKYAFPENIGQISIKLESNRDQLELTVADNGLGISKELVLKTSKTLGLQLVNSLINQLDGRLELDTIQGTKFKIIFKELEYENRI